MNGIPSDGLAEEDAFEICRWLVKLKRAIHPSTWVDALVDQQLAEMNRDALDRLI